MNEINAMSSSNSVADWDAVFKKGVRSKDGKYEGTVVGVSDEKVIFQHTPDKVVMLPKNKVETFDGNELILSVDSDEVRKHAISS